MNIRLLLCITLGLGVPVAAHAAPDADICYSKPEPMSMPGRPAPDLALLTSKTILKCPRAGDHTLPEPAQAGWRIIAVEDEATSTTSAPAVSYRVVIERDK